jgi:hypothetical protein
MGLTLTVNRNEEQGKQTPKHQKRIVQIGTQHTGQQLHGHSHSSFSSSPIRSIIACKIERGVEHP